MANEFTQKFLLGLTLITPTPELKANFINLINLRITKIIKSDTLQFAIVIPWELLFIEIGSSDQNPEYM